MSHPRHNVGSGTSWEDRYGYARAVRLDRSVHVSGTVAVGPDGPVGRSDAGDQARFILKKIERALWAAGARVADVVRTRMYVTDIEADHDAIGSAHGAFFGGVRPATAMVQVAALIEPWMKVEIEAEAWVPPYPMGRPIIREATVGDAEAVAVLLRSENLPIPEASDGTVPMLVAHTDGKVQGCIGWEARGPAALLRSLAVDPAARGRKLGVELVLALLCRLERAGCPDVYLLTPDAADFFSKFGFERVERADVPESVRESRQFSTAVCAAATVMRRRVG